MTFKLLDFIDDAGALGYPVWIRDFGRTEEGANGADLELWFYDRSTGAATGWLIQAKRLSPRQTPGRAPKFESLKHYVDGSWQVDLLIDAASATPGLVPLYWLYAWDFHDSSTCSEKPSCKCGPDSTERALMVAPASWVKSGPGTSWHKVVADAPEIVKSLQHLLCAAPVSVQGLAASIHLLLASVPGKDDPDEPPGDAEFGTEYELPEYVRVFIDGDVEPDRAPADRDRQLRASSSARQLAVIEL